MARQKKLTDKEIRENFEICRRLIDNLDYLRQQHKVELADIQKQLQHVRTQGSYNWRLNERLNDLSKQIEILRNDINTPLNYGPNVS